MRSRIGTIAKYVSARAIAQANESADDAPYKNHFIRLAGKRPEGARQRTLIRRSGRPPNPRRQHFQKDRTARDAIPHAAAKQRHRDQRLPDAELARPAGRSLGGDGWTALFATLDFRRMPSHFAPENHQKRGGIARLTCCGRRGQCMCGRPLCIIRRWQSGRNGGASIDTRGTSAAANRLSRGTAFHEFLIPCNTSSNPVPTR